MEKYQNYYKVHQYTPGRILDYEDYNNYLNARCAAWIAGISGWYDDPQPQNRYWPGGAG